MFRALVQGRSFNQGVYCIYWCCSWICSGCRLPGAMANGSYRPVIICLLQHSQVGGVDAAIVHLAHVALAPTTSNA